MPVLSEGGVPLGVLDVLVLMEGALQGGDKAGASAKGGGMNTASRWRGLLTSSESLVGVSAHMPGATSKPGSAVASRPGSLASAEPPMPPPAAVASAPAHFSLPPSVATSRTGSQADASERNGSESGAAGAAAGAPAEKLFLFKVTEPRSANMHRLHASPSDLAALEKAVSLKLGRPVEEAAGAEGGAPRRLLLRYDDDEGDRVLITSDAELSEACEMAASLGKKGLVLHASFERAASTPSRPTPLGEHNSAAVPPAASNKPAAAKKGNAAGRMLGGALLGMSEQERIMGAGALLATLMVGVSAIAGRR